MCQSLGSVTIGNNVKTIGESAFYKCSSLTSITIPKCVTSIGIEAFSNCNALTEIIVDEDNTMYRSVNGVLYSKDMALLHTYPSGKQVEEFIIPDGVLTIGEWAFSHNSLLTSVTISNTVETIKYGAFYYCEPLKNITLGNNVEIIEDRVFWGCSSLYSITIPNKITTISDAAFYICESLASLTIGENVEAIKSCAFYGCESLSEIYAMPVTPPTCSGQYDFWEVDKGNCVLYVPEESVEQYKNAEVWKDFTQIKAYKFPADIGVIFSKQDNETYHVYNIDGTLVLTTADKTQIYSLPKGTYIINGKKIIVK